MVMRRIFVWVVAAGLILGCAGTSKKKINRVRLGMTKPEVIAVMGEPNYSNVREDIEILNYELTADSISTEDHIVRLKQGKVDLFGRRGDFGSLYEYPTTSYPFYTPTIISASSRWRDAGSNTAKYRLQSRSVPI